MVRLVGVVLQGRFIAAPREILRVVSGIGRNPDESGRRRTHHIFVVPGVIGRDEAIEAPAAHGQ